MKTKLSMFLLFLPMLLFAQVETDFIHIDQFGYRLNDEKIAVISDPQTGYNSNQSFTPGTSYQLKSINGNTVFTADIVPWNNGDEDDSSGDKAWHFDFSSVTTAGEYYVFDETNNVISFTFSIDDEVYVPVLKQALRTFYYQRCGTPKSAPFAQADWTDGQCHRGAGQDLTCRLATDKNNAATEKDLSGGWHDAGDYNKYVNYSLNPVHDLLSAFEENPEAWGDDFNIPESGNGTPDILDELKWELDWLLKMQLADGSVLMKVSVDMHQGTSPPSADDENRYYGPAQSSATRSACSMFAHASIVFEGAGLTTYANVLKEKAILAWSWLQANPGFSNYDNSGFESSNPEHSNYEQEATSFTAAVYLFALTGESVYKAYVDANYASIHAISWGFWYPFEPVFQDALLYYAASANGTAAIKSTILDNFKSSVKTDNVELLPAYNSFSSPYRAFISSNNYVWGSSKVKAHSAGLFYNMITYQVDEPANQTYQNAAINYLHYLHGVNPQNLTYLTNMNDYGASKSCTEIYHLWFADGTGLDANPAPGFVSGGPNKNFDPPANFTISPPENQPNEKCYKDWNTSYPENSWEITEPSITYQASYLKMISKFVGPSSPLPVEILHPLTATAINNNKVLLKWTTATEINNKGFEIQRSDENLIFEKIDFIPAKTIGSKKIYQVIDGHPLARNYYRYKQIDLDGKTTFSDIVSINISKTYFNITPNIITNGQINMEFDLNASSNGTIEIFSSNGMVVAAKDLGYLSKGGNQLSIDKKLPAGSYLVVVRINGEVLVRSFLVR